MTTGTPRIGVVGAAHWARTVHLEGALASGANVVGVWSRTPSSTQSAADEYGVRAFETFDELIDAVDIVTMAVPPIVQADLALRAAQAGKHLLLDKPMATTVRDAVAIQEAVLHHDLACLVFHTRRFIPEIEEAVIRAADQRFSEGTICMHYPVMTDPDTPFARTDWRLSDNVAYWELGPHALAASIPVLGPITAVDAKAQVGPERVVTWTTTHAENRRCHYSLTTFADPARQARCRFTFRHATASAPPLSHEEYTLPDPPHARADTFGDAVERLAHAVATGERFDPSGADLGVEIVRVLEAAHRSIESGKVVYVER